MPIYAGANEGESTDIDKTILENTEENSVTANLEEVETERDAYSKTYVDEQGQFTKEVYAEPIHTEINGEWVEISTDLSLNKEEGILETETTQLQAVYPSKISSNKEILYTFGDHSLEFTNITASNGQDEFQFKKDTTTSYQDNKVTYEEVLPGIDLRHVSLNNEVKEDWIINDYQGISQFHYVVNTDLIAQLEEDGSINFYEDKSMKEKVFTLPTPMMEDSNFNEGLGNGVKSDALVYELEQISQNEYAIRLIVDKSWLESEDRVFPVYVDPSVTINMLGDTFVSSAYPTTNYNKEWDSSQGEYVLKVGKYDSTTGTNYAFIKFAIVGDLKGAVIDAADLKVYVTHSYYATQKTGLWVDKANAYWTADLLTWNNKPSSTNITSTTVARDQWATFNVKQTVQDWVDTKYANEGFKFHTNGNGQSYWKKITAGESANKAKIVISYHYPTMKNPTVKATQTSVGASTGYVDVSWPSVYGATGGYELQMFNGKSFETIYTGTATTWSSKDKKIFPKTPYSTSSTFKLDKTGVELPVDPSAYYTAKSGTSTTRKEYGFRVIAKYSSGNSPASSEVKKAIPANLVETPDIPSVQAFAYPETDTTNKGRGWLEISWDKVPNATNYRVLILNGKNYEEFSVGNVNKWSTKGQKIWPTDAEVAAGKFALHHDKTGVELAANPNPVYINSGGYQKFKRYSIRVKAESSLGVTPYSDSIYGYIPIEKPKNVKVTSTVITDDAQNLGEINVQWDAVTDAGGYVVNVFDGEEFVSYDVGNTTKWNSKGIELFPGIENLPVDPTSHYKKVNTTNQTVLDKKAYLVNVQAYYHTYQNSPDTVEKEKLEEEFRGLSAKSSNLYASFTADDSLVGLEDYFTYGTHTMGTSEVSVNVTTGNLTLSQTDHSLFTKGNLGFDFTRYYNSKSNQSSVLGRGWSFEGSEYLIKAASNNNFFLWDEDGTRHEFVYNTTNSTYTSPKGKYLTLQDTILNNRAAFTLTDKSGFVKIFEADPNTPNKFRVYAYRDGNNNQISFKYVGSELREVAEVDTNNNTIRKSISLVYKNGLLYQTKYVDRTVEYVYNAENQLSDMLIKAAGTTKVISNLYGYDEESGLLTEYIDAKENENTISYSPNEISILTPQEDGKESIFTTYQFNKNKNEYTVLDTAEKKTQYRRDTTNKTFAVTDIINNDGTSSKSTYDSNYNVLTTADEKGQTESNIYFANGNIKSEIEKDGKQTQYVKYDDKNQLLEKIDPDGVKTVNVYDGYNLKTTTIGEEVTSYEYDGMGRVTKVTNPNNTYTQTVYDEANKRVTVTDAKGVTTSSYYNDYGQVVKEVDGENRSQSYTFDVLYPDIKKSVTDGNGTTTTYAYDDNGNMVSLTDALNRKKSYTYNGNDDLLTSSFPRKGSAVIKTSNLYDVNGNLQQVTQNSGITERYEYDDVDLLKKVTVKNKNGTATFEWNQTYDSAGQLTMLNFKDIVANRSVIKNYQYTVDNLVDKYTQGSYEVNYHFDSLNRVDNQTINYNGSVPITIKQNFSYTDEGKIKQVVSETDNSSNKLTLDYTYNLKQNKAAVSYHAGLINSDYQYDDSNNLTKIAYLKNTQSFLSFSYTYDKSGNIKTETNKAGTTTYFYDASNQLTREELPNGTVNEYSYDKVGNRETFVQNGKEISKYTYNEANQVETKNTKPVFTYDGDGNLTKDDSYSYAYNDMSTLTTVSTLSGSLVAKYEYDNEGLRTKKIVGTKTYEYYYDGEEDHLTLEVMSVNDQIQQYRYYQWDTFGKAVGMTIKQKASDGTWKTSVYYFLTNQRGDVSSIIDSAGVEVGSYSYDAYGNMLSETGTIAKENNIRYASYYYDQETKHYYLKARYYDPVNGIFQALDPHPGDEDDPVSQNGYTYAGNNPVINVDPDGDFFWMAVNVGFAAYDGYKAYKAGGSAAKIAGVAALAIVGGPKLKALKKASHAVYTLNKGGKVVYVGRTRNIKARAKSHSKVHSDATFNIEKKGLTYAQARGLEHRLYLKNGGKKNLRNKIRPISKKNKKYKQYMSVSRSVYK